MKKKQYIAPEMEIHILRMSQQLLTISGENPTTDYNLDDVGDSSDEWAG